MFQADSLVWSQCECGCAVSPWYVLSILSPPEDFPESPMHRCHAGGRRWTHQECVLNRSMSPTSEGYVEEGSHLCRSKEMIHFNGLIKTSNSGCKWLELKTLLYPYSKCQRTQRSCRVHSAGSVWPSSAGAAGRKRRVSERYNGCLVSRQTGSSWFQLAGKPPPTRVLSNVISHGGLWLLSTTMCTLAGLLWNLMIWRTEGQQQGQLKRCAGIIIVEAPALTKILCGRTSVMWNPLCAKRPSFLVKEQHSSIHIHRHCLSAGSHHLHLRMWKNAAVHV